MVKEGKMVNPIGSNLVPVGDKTEIALCKPTETTDYKRSSNWEQILSYKILRDSWVLLQDWR